MKIFRQAMLAALLLAGGMACGRKVRIPKPDSVPAETADHKDIAKAQDRYRKIITEFKLKIIQLRVKIVSKREKGFNTSQAEAVLKQLEEGIETTARELLFWGKFGELNEKLREYNQLAKDIEKLTKSAPSFEGKPIKKEKAKVLKYGLDDRERVRELMGEPDPKNKHFRYSLTVRLTVFNAGPVLKQSKCWNPMFNQFVLDNPPEMESWYYPEDQTIYIFVQENPLLFQFMMHNELIPQQRDQLLMELCEKQFQTENFKLIYAGHPVADLDSILEQLLTGQMRFAGMFGMEGLERIMRSTAVLPDLAIVALAFNTKFYILNRLQAERYQMFYDLATQLLPEATTQNPITVNKKNGLGKAKAALVKKQKEAIAKILVWQQTLNPNAKDIDNLVKLFPDWEEAIRAIAGLFRTTLLELSDQFEAARKDLLKFRKDYVELLFGPDDFITIFCLLEGVRFDEKILADKSIAQVPDLSLKVTVKRRLGKYDPPVFEKESPEIKITNANRYIDVTKEYQRLTNFGVVFPFKLSPGKYEITLTVSDHLRVQAVQQQINWTVVPEGALEKK